MVKIHTEFITLQQLLKMENWISSGGEAKHFLSHENVQVNGENESRRGRKLYPGDHVLVQGKDVVIEK